MNKLFYSNMQIFFTPIPETNPVIKQPSNPCSLTAPNTVIKQPDSTQPTNLHKFCLADSY